MTFPETQLTLIIRLARGGSEADWQQFLADYWGPIVRFAARRGALPLDQAEDVAAETFLLLIKAPLISRWQAQPTGKLRSLLCGVVRNLLSNRQRVEQGRRRLLRQVADAGGLPDVLDVSDTPEPPSNDLDVFYHTWVDELLAQTMRKVLYELYSEGRGDYFRALYGRICDGLSTPEIAEALGTPASTVENYLRVAKSRLTSALKQALREQVARYSTAEDAFEQEWSQLHNHLEQFGGLETAIRKEAQSLDRLPAHVEQSDSFVAASEMLRKAAAKGPEPR